MIRFLYNDRVLTILLDSNIILRDNLSTTEVANNSLNKIDSIDINDNMIIRVISGLYTNTKSSRIRDSLAVESNKLN